MTANEIKHKKRLGYSFFTRSSGLFLQRAASNRPKSPAHAVKNTEKKKKFVLHLESACLQREMHVNSFICTAWNEIVRLLNRLERAFFFVCLGFFLYKPKAFPDPRQRSNMTARVSDHITYICLSTQSSLCRNLGHRRRHSNSTTSQHEVKQSLPSCYLDHSFPRLPTRIVHS